VALTHAEDLKCGDVFTFRGDSYVALAQFSDNRHVQTVVVAILAEDYAVPLKTHKTVVALQLIRTLELDVTGRVGLKLTVATLTAAEAAGLPVPQTGSF